MHRDALGSEMAKVRQLFVTSVYEASLAGATDFAAFNGELEAACRMMAAEDRAGRAWSRAHGFGGYTSYASLADLVTRATAFAVLKRRLAGHVRAFASDLRLDLGRRTLVLDSLWVSLLRRGAPHGGHVHPLSVISGTYYVAVPAGAGGLRFEDPRQPLMMAAPPSKADAGEAHSRYVTFAPRIGDILLWESWLRHEVVSGTAKADRISVSFNYAWR
jgi:uncharacterized protein (TIGR02466 family)